MKRENLIIGLGVATLLAAPFVISACQTTGGNWGQEKAMMKEGGAFSENTVKECRCAQEGKQCDCKEGTRGSSCGGEGKEDSDGEGSCGKN